MNLAVFLVLLVLACIAALPWYLESKRHRITEADRAASVGRFADLSQGTTHYRWYGPTRGPVVLAIHGLTTPSVVWAAVATGLGAIGFRVLTYDLYGRGLSDSVAGAQDRSFFLRQIDDLLADQGLDTKEVTLMGYSMGASIAVAYAAQNPHRVARVILLAGAGVKMLESRLWRLCRELPLIGDWIHGVFAARQMQADLNMDGGTDVPDWLMATQSAALERQGYLPAVLASRRGILSMTQTAAHQKISRDGIPLIAIWGGRDPLMPLSVVGELARWNRHARQEVIEDAGHGLPYTHAEEVVARLTAQLTDLR